VTKYTKSHDVIVVDRSRRHDCGAARQRSWSRCGSYRKGPQIRWYVGNFGRRGVDTQSWVSMAHRDTREEALTYLDAVDPGAGQVGRQRLETYVDTGRKC